MKAQFCTLFNSAYLSRGLALLESLDKNCPDFHLYIFAFDDVAHHYLLAHPHPRMTVISLKEFEDEKLLAIKATRTAGEYCWTCTPSTIRYCIQTYHLDHCTYIDADMWFYSDPRVLIEEMGSKSVLISEHRYTKEYDQTVRSGKYCVQFMCFRNDEKGMHVLHWWRDRCIEWCYARHEDGKFGDQKYLDDWMTRFDCVHEMQHLGGGVAPWNVQQYQLKVSGSQIELTHENGSRQYLVFYHFHDLRFYDGEMISLTGAGYELSSHVKQIIYRPYVKVLHDIGNRVTSGGAVFNPHGSGGKPPFGPIGLFNILWYYLKDLKGSMRNVFGQRLGYRIRHHYYYKVMDFIRNV